MILRIITSIMIGLTLSFLIVIPLTAHQQFAPILESPISIINRKDKGITLYDRQGRSFFHFYEAASKRIIPLSEVPEHFQQAVIAIEDQTFYTHRGISLQGIIRSAITNAKAGKIVYGGSTITQQLIKSTLLTNQKSWLRKYKEAILALELEMRYTKPEILEMYFNTAYFGEGAFGLEEAAQTYFKKPAKELTISESALLAGILTQPSLLSPLSHEPGAAISRQRLVLDSMVKLNFISTNDKEKVLAQPLTFNTEPILRNQAAPHFALYVRDQLVKQYGEQYVVQSGLKVKTTIDLDIQKQAETALALQLKKLQSRRANNGSVIVIDPTTHEILAMVGSKDWFDPKWGKVNMAITPRQTGSAFKPIVYATALEKHIITPAAIINDVPTTFSNTYRPVDYDGRFRGPVTVRRALANSLNVPAVAIMEKVGVRSVTSLAENLGITTLSEAKDYNLALALGAGEINLTELTNAYATLAAEGNFLPAQSILAVFDKQNLPIPTKTTRPQQALSSAASFLISSMLSDNKARAEVFGNSLTISRPAAVKTGTSQNYRDAWTIGYTPQLTVGVWIGNNDNTPMNSLAGALGAAPVWRSLMEDLSVNKPSLTFIPPSSITQATVCNTRKTKVTQAVEGEQPFEAQEIRTIVNQEYFIAGSEPQGRCFNTRPRPTQKPELVRQEPPEKV